jgi:hypothetical protein
LAILGLVAVGVAIHFARRHGPSCSTPGPGTVGADASRWLTAAIEDIPCPSTGRVSYGTKDNRGDEMASLDPIDGPASGYLGVYDSAVASRAKPGVSIFSVSLARSADLIRWTRLRVLDSTGASMPTLRAIPGAAGYLLAYEKHLSNRASHSIRVRYYASPAALLGNRFSAQINLPLRLSRYSNGTPAFLAIDWHGGLQRSTIELAFHYETSSRQGKPGPDREAFGTLRDFRDWTVSSDGTIDTLLDRKGLLGSHGDRRQFIFGGKLWRVYEAQRRFGDFATWHVLLYDVASKRFRELRFATSTVRASSSFGNPTAQLLRAPGGHGAALVVTTFVFGTGEAASHPGELVYYQPVR